MNGQLLKRFALTVCLLLTVLTTIAQQLDARFDLAQFKADKTTYLETYLSINSQGVKFIKNKNNNFQAQLTVTIQFLNKEKVITADKYNLFSPEVIDTNSIDFVFIDQQRFTLENGVYNLKLNIVDVNNSKKEINHQQEIEIKAISNGFSDIELVQSYKETNKKNIFSKNGYDLVPFISNLYNSENKKLNCYFEYYNSKEEEVLIQNSIIYQENREIVNSLVKSKKTNSATFSSLNSFSIEDLPSGTYILRTEARNKKNELIHSKEREFFKLNKNIKIEEVDVNRTFVNSINNIDSLALYIQYTYPIQSPSESSFADNVLDYENLEMMQKFFYAFWKERDPFNSEQSWLNYLAQVELVNKEFKNGLVDGFLSDRGRIFLSYGSPNSRVEEVLPNQFQPFEVWHYYNIGTERNVKFIFSNRIMANEYRLVYSNKIGEVSDRDWLERFEENYYDGKDNGQNSPFDYFNTPN